MDTKSYISLNAMLNLWGEGGTLQLDKDKEAARQYFLQHVNQNTVFFHTLEEKLDYLVEEKYYDKEVLDKYEFQDIKDLFKMVYSQKHRFEAFVSALKFYTQYALKNFSGDRYLERYEDRIVMTALALADGDIDAANNMAVEMIHGRYQPATPTFLNAGKAQRGEYTSCFPAGSPVTLKGGSTKAIEEVAEGDEVLTHSGSIQKVTGTIENNGEHLRIVTIQSVGGISVDLTENHPVLVYSSEHVEGLDIHPVVGDGYRWVEAKDVRVNKDYLITPHEGTTGSLAKVINVDFSDPIDTVYNLEVEDENTYVVSDVAVHNCTLLQVSDNMESIARAFTDSLQLSKRGAGVGLNLTDLREQGAPIKNIEGQSSGIVPVMKILEDSFKYANQLGARQGAGAVYLHAHHPDIMRFMDTKRENADEAVRIKTLSIGIIIPDITFDLARKNEDMYLFSPYDVQKVYGVPFSEVDVSAEYYNMVENKEISKTKTNARQLFTTIAELNFESGYPYLLFIDTANRKNPVDGIIKTSNLCLSGDTKILTDEGYKRMDELYKSQEEIKVQSDNRAVNLDSSSEGISIKDSTTMHLTARDAEVFEVVTSNGYSIRATDWHKMYVIRDGQVVKVPLSQVSKGDELLIQPEASVAFGSTVNTSLGKGIDVDGDFPQEIFTHNKESQERFVGDVFFANAVAHTPPKRVLWSMSSLDEHSYISQVSLSSNNRDFLSDLQVLMINLGIVSTLVNNTIHIDDEFSLSVLKDAMGIDAHREGVSLHSGTDVVVSITPAGTEDVYDVTVDDGHSIIVNGIVTGNCSEILQSQTDSTFDENGYHSELGDDISCNLGSMNIAKAMEGGDLGQTVDVAMRMLTKVAQVSDISCSPSIHKRNQETLPVGLGQMNLHGFLGKEKIMYGSPEALDFVSSYMAAINYHTLVASCTLAKENGRTFRGFESSDYASGEYFDLYLNQEFTPSYHKVSQVFDKYGIELPTIEDWQELKKDVMKHGLFNQYRQAVAPTGSISYVNYSTSSMLPITSRVEIRKEGMLGRVYYPAPYMNDDNLDYYQDAYTLGPQAIIDTYAAAAPHVDQGMSMTLFFPSDSTTRDINRAQISAWKTGEIKTIYYIRLRQDALEGTETECVSCAV